MLTKNTFVEEIRKQYVLVARAKGLSERRVLYKHVFRNALIPIVTGFPAAFVGAFFAGSLLIETLFSLDGLGLLSLRVDRPPRLSGRAGHAVLLHADRPRREADRRPAVRRRRPARAVRGGGEVSEHRRRSRSRRLRQPPPAAPPRRPRCRPTSGRGRASSATAWATCRCVVFVAMLVVATFAELVSNDRPLVARYQGEWFFPIVQQSAGDALRRRLQDADRLARSVHPRAVRASDGNCALFTLNPYARQHAQLLRQGARARRRRARENWLGTDEAGRDMVARLLYGFRISV